MARRESSGATGFLRKINDAFCERLTAAGLFVAGMVMTKTTTTTISATGATTLTAAQMLSGHLLYTGNGAATWTTPTAALLVAAATQLTGTGKAANEAGGATFELLIRNTGNNTLTLAAGDGCTITMAALDTITTGKSHLLCVQIVTTTSGSQAYSIFPKGNAFTP